jgi:hypothetical protein
VGEELVPRGEQSALERAGAKIDETSLTFSNPAALTFEHFAEICGSFLAPIGRGYPWWVGDILNMAEDVLGEEWAQLEPLLPSSPQTQANYKSVAKHVPRSRRRGLHLSTVEPVAYMPPKARDELIKQAVDEGWKREEMREAARAAKVLAAGGNPNIYPSRDRKTCPHCGHELED